MEKLIEEFDVKPTAKFEKDVVFYMKKKKYIHIIDDIKTVKVELAQGNFVGDEIPNLRLESGGHTYKVRAANTDMKVGKSNGYRIIYSCGGFNTPTLASYKGY